MRRAATAGLALLILTGCGAPETPRHAATGGSCQVARVIDGDTVDMACADIGTFRARLVGYDTPEITSPGCAQELALGRLARQRLTQIVREADRVDAQMGEFDRYNRRLVRLAFDGEDVAQTLVSEGLAVGYSGGRRINWCARLG